VRSILKDKIDLPNQFTESRSILKEKILTIETTALIAATGQGVGKPLALIFIEEGLDN